MKPIVITSEIFYDKDKDSITLWGYVYFSCNLHCLEHTARVCVTKEYSTTNNFSNILSDCVLELPTEYFLQDNMFNVTYYKSNMLLKLLLRFILGSRTFLKILFNKNKFYGSSGVTLDVSTLNDIGYKVSELSARLLDKAIELSEKD